MSCTKRSIFVHITARLAHEPHRRTIDRLTPAGFEEAIIHHFGILETRREGVNSQWDGRRIEVRL